MQSHMGLVLKEAPKVSPSYVVVKDEILKPNTSKKLVTFLTSPIKSNSNFSKVHLQPKYHFKA